MTLDLMLKKSGFIIDKYDDSYLAFLNFRPNKYCLLLTDVRMPRLNGFDLYARIKQIDPKIKVCFMTSFISYYISLTEAYPTINTKCFIKKPVETKKLLYHIRQELGI